MCFPGCLKDMEINLLLSGNCCDFSDWPTHSLSYFTQSAVKDHLGNAEHLCGELNYCFWIPRILVNKFTYWGSEYLFNLGLSATKIKFCVFKLSFSLPVAVYQQLWEVEQTVEHSSTDCRSKVHLKIFRTFFFIPTYITISYSYIGYFWFWTLSVLYLLLFLYCCFTCTYRY